MDTRDNISKERKEIVEDEIKKILEPDPEMNVMRKKAFEDLGFKEGSPEYDLLKTITDAYFSAGKQSALKIINLMLSGVLDPQTVAKVVLSNTEERLKREEEEHDTRN